ncbi:MAG TPA: endopeptidase La [Lacunisphaera sp.]|jgi:ATP-dependent Lon protease|nr:endopeptidase La [Lacunisphaera sp.]
MARATMQPDAPDAPAAEGVALVPDTLPILPLRRLVLFPGLVVTLSVNDPGARRLLEALQPAERVIGIFTRRSEAEDDDAATDLLAPVGVAAMVLKLSPGEGGVLQATVNVFARVALGPIAGTEPFLRARVDVIDPIAPPADDPAWVATVQELRERATQYARVAAELPPPTASRLRTTEEPGELSDLLAAHLPLSQARKQELLQTAAVEARVRAVLLLVSDQLEISRLRRKIDEEVSQHFGAAERRAYLREQMRLIQKELGEDGTEQQAADLRRRLREAGAPEAVLAQADRELRRLTRLPAAGSEASLVVTYVELLAELPWQRQTEDHFDLDRARAVLDRDHFDLDKVKRRLVEFLAVCKLNPTGSGPVLCLVGPPGVGKTSLGQSVADALGRKFARISLGGVSDEAEIRGHRRTYVGAMPGRLMQELRRAGVRNPVLMLDEIDKLGLTHTGDPASALLEVLDPRQNHAFVDRYLDVPFDLSRIIFIATANFMDDVPPALRDRLEVIRIPGYTDDDKRAIAERYLIPRQVAENGLKAEQARFQTAAVSRLIEDYTREAGVRGLERQIGAVCRHLAALVAEAKPHEADVTPSAIESILGPPRFIREARLTVAKPGIVTGLAWTPVGGEIMHIEAVKFPGKGSILLTGQLGSVMRESAQAALSLVRAHAAQLRIRPVDLRDHDIHIHVPAGGVSKDGPSAGVGMLCAIATLFNGGRVRADVAMTGEITLRGLVLPIGGLKEKLLAAERAGIPTVIVPKLNEKDLVDLPAGVRERLEIVLVGTIDELLAAALVPAAKPRRAPKKARVKR